MGLTIGEERGKKNKDKGQIKVKGNKSKLRSQAESFITENANSQNQ
jgi:hypothetical protein